MSDHAGTVLGIDIGGTKMAAAMVSADGRIVTEDRIVTPAGDADQVFAALAELIGRVQRGAGPGAIGRWRSGSGRLVRWIRSTDWCRR